MIYSLCDNSYRTEVQQTLEEIEEMEFWCGYHIGYRSVGIFCILEIIDKCKSRVEEAVAVSAFRAEFCHELELIGFLICAYFGMDYHEICRSIKIISSFEYSPCMIYEGPEWVSEDRCFEESLKMLQSYRENYEQQMIDELSRFVEKKKVIRRRNYGRFNQFSINVEKQRLNNETKRYNESIKDRIQNADSFNEYHVELDFLCGHQKAGCILASKYDRFAFFYDTGTGKTIMSLYEWKYILSSLKLFIFQFYAIDNFNKEKNLENFYDKNLFDLALELYFKYPKNNLYQNIFIDMIKLLNYEKTPNYLINHFIKKQNIFIENIKNIIKAKDKYNLLLGPNIQILLIFYTSSNPELIQFYQSDKNKNEKKSKEKFFDIVKKRFERSFNDNYEFTMDEIFSDFNDSLDTFDGNDLDNVTKIKFESFKTTVENYINKLNFDFDMNINLNNKIMSEKNENKIEEPKSTTETTQTKFKDEKNEFITENIVTFNSDEPSLSRNTEMKMSENRSKS